MLLDKVLMKMCIVVFLLLVLVLCFGFWFLVFVFLFLKLVISRQIFFIEIKQEKSSLFSTKMDHLFH